MLEVRSRRVGGATYQVPVEVPAAPRPHARRPLARRLRPQPPREVDGRAPRQRDHRRAHRSRAAPGSARTTSTAWRRPTRPSPTTAGRRPRPRWRARARRCGGRGALAWTLRPPRCGRACRRARRSAVSLALRARRQQAASCSGLRVASAMPVTASAERADHLEPEAALGHRLGVEERLARRRRACRPRSASGRSTSRKISSAMTPDHRDRDRGRLRGGEDGERASAPIANTAITTSALPWRSAPPWESSASPPGGVNSKVVISSEANRQIAATRQASGSSRVSRVTSVTCAPPIRRARPRPGAFPGLAATASSSARRGEQPARAPGAAVPRSLGARAAGAGAGSAAAAARRRSAPRRPRSGPRSPRAGCASAPS